MIWCHSGYFKMIWDPLSSILGGLGIISGSFCGDLGDVFVGLRMILEHFGWIWSALGPS